MPETRDKLVTARKLTLAILTRIACYPSSDTLYMDEVRIYDDNNYQFESVLLCKNAPDVDAMFIYILYYTTS